MSPSPSPSPSTSSEQYDLAHLDSLLATYLSHLDTYTRARESLSADFSSGFFSLAQAQRSSMLAPGRRYGEEMYDERTKASRRVRFNERREGLRRVDQEGKERPWEIQVFTYPEVPPEGTATTIEEKKSDSPEEPSHPTRIPNPITMFAALPPPALRASQSSFTNAVSGSIATLINTSRCMTELEAEIGRVRHMLGLTDDVDVENNANQEDVGSPNDHGIDGDNERARNKDERQEDTPTSPKQQQRQKSKTKKHLPSHTGKVSEPRSRVLKLGS